MGSSMIDENIILQRLQDIFAERLGVNVNAVTRQANFETDLGADSLDVIEVIMAIEEKFNLDIDDQAASNFETVDDLVKHIAKEMEV